MGCSSLIRTHNALPTASFYHNSANFTVKCSSNNLSSHSGLVERPWKVADARFVLEDGSIWRAKSFGASGTQIGEVVFNTSLTGFPVLPTYASRFQQCFLAGLVIRSLSISSSNWRCKETLGDYLAERNINVNDVDTRAITRRLREDGSLIGVLSTENSKSERTFRNVPYMGHLVFHANLLVNGLGGTASAWDFEDNGRNKDTFNVVAYDFGIKQNILRHLASYSCKITVVPSTLPASETLKMRPDGVLFSNGPGNPSAVPYSIGTIKELIGKIPVFGICMGHQLLGQALGGKTFRMKFGHHGGNHPVRNLRNSSVEFSAQNHNYAVNPESLLEGVELMLLQYHPEASPGPHDSDPVFGEFIQLMKQEKVKA
ncbi:hypothetical protein K7X08_003010 [Anisodus acutangulus]|uniref:carbamoyl-phosphate synthase (glutamine-hydrolyzing) n=1 Tax=Anisodus acutangulus TaxID=402998 RepID=A0A9Q1RI99_9SOLA|nr:hypothetical protein K7X08_003010 [Anisodus acutangulus]